MRARAGADVDQVIAVADAVFVVLDHHERDVVNAEAGEIRSDGAIGFAILLPRDTGLWPVRVTLWLNRALDSGDFFFAVRTLHGPEARVTSSVLSHATTRPGAVKLM